MRILSIILLICLFSLGVAAEYRVFRLKIMKKNAPAGDTTPPTAPPPPSEGREVISTLDPDQYRGYYPVQEDEVVTYSQTWMCRGRTGDHKDICPPPETPIPATSSASPEAP